MVGIIMGQVHRIGAETREVPPENKAESKNRLSQVVLLALYVCHSKHASSHIYRHIQINM